MQIALVMGAGASLANAQHFRGERRLDTHPPLDTTFFQKIHALDMTLHPALRSYIRRLMGYEPTPRLLESQRMEEFFKDVYYDFQSNSKDANLRRAYIELVRMYTTVLRETTNWLCEDSRGGAPIGKLIAAAAEAASSVSVITFNHDLVIENDIFKRRRLRKRWCVEMSYGEIAKSMTITRSGIGGADFPRHGPDCDHANPIAIHKLHGSLNWVFRLRGQLPTERQLTGEATPSELFLTQRREIPRRLRYTIARSGRGRSSWWTWPLIIPPIYAKQALIHLLDPVWAAARRDLQHCDRIVFFGYSLPGADIEAEKLFQRAISSNDAINSVEIINPDPSSASRYASLAPRKALGWYPDVERFLSHGGFDSSG